MQTGCLGPSNNSEDSKLNAFWAAHIVFEPKVWPPALGVVSQILLGQTYLKNVVFPIFAMHSFDGTDV